MSSPTGDAPVTKAFASRSVFDIGYSRFDLAQLTPNQSKQEADLIERLLEMRPSSDVLDAPCGNGRIANNLGAKGHRVTGVDASRAFIDLAIGSALAEGGGRFAVGDLRAMDFAAQFDYAISWYGSFGMYTDRAEIDILERYQKSLRHGGKLLIDVQSIHRLSEALRATHGVSTFVSKMDNDYLFDTRRFDAVEGIIHGERIMIIDSAVHNSAYSLRAIAATELSSWLKSAGFCEVEYFDETEASFSIMSRRMIAIARKE